MNTEVDQLTIDISFCSSENIVTVTYMVRSI
jgi:hypothetical protein